MDHPAPRIAPLAAGEWDERLRRVLEASPGGTDEPMHIFTTLGRANPELFRRWLGFGGALLSGTLPGRLRELVILRTASRFGGRYEWAHHLELAAAEGISGPELAALGAEGPLEATALAALERDALRRGRRDGRPGRRVRRDVGRPGGSSSTRAS